MVVDSKLPHAEFELNDHRKDAPPFTYLYCQNGTSILTSIYPDFSHDYGKFIRVFLEKLHQNGVLNDVIDFQRSVQQIKPKPAPIRARRRSKKMEN